jgi:superfamily II DNA/RNA helicase
MQLLKQDEENGVTVPAGRPRALILLPSRELATQILVRFIQFCSC